MTSPRPAVLRNRAALLAALVFCIYAALPRSLTSLRSISHATKEQDPILIFGLIAATVITVSIATRTSFLGDRIVFGVAAAAFVLRLITILISPNPSAALVIGGLVSLMWAIGAVASLVFLISASRQRTG